jgi:stearoyl-CoA desaturase (delta-9 desaturase)
MRNNRPTAVALLLIHAGALAALWPRFFSWSAVAAAAILMYVTGAIGIALAYHRTLTHRGLRLWKPLEYAASICGCLALQGSPIDWVATHRAHHANTDRAGDPHDASEGLGWAHYLWMVMPNRYQVSGEGRLRYAADLCADPVYRMMSRYQIAFTLLLAGALYALGGASWVVWGIFVRLVVVYHVTWLVNSAAHTTGYRSFRTGDRSTNCWWVALLGWGEGWHNNHHAFPFSARLGLRWYELDVTWLTVRLLQILGLAAEVKQPSPAMMTRLRIGERR